MTIHGKWHAKGSAAQLSAALHVVDGNYRLDTNKGMSLTGAISTIEVSDRLGSVERKLTFEDGSIFATNDNDAVDAVFKGRNKIMGMVDKIESNIGWVAVALLLTIGATFSFFKWGVPTVSRTIAHALPEKTNKLIASETLVFLDKFLFEESALDAEVQENIRTHFQTNIVPLGGETEIEYTLHFRDWSDDDEGIPNALALPSGDIVLTDEFVNLSESQNEIDAVLLHEMGHVVHRHSLIMIIESTFVTTAVMMVTGDTSGIADMGIGLGSLLLSTNYARRHESEADIYAFEHMLTARIDPAAFSSIMARITKLDKSDNSSEDSTDTGNANTDEHVSNNDTASDSQIEITRPENPTPTNSGAKKSDTINDDILGYLSTHPSTAERIELAKRYSRCFQAGLVVCDPGILSTEYEAQD